MLCIRMCFGHPPLQYCWTVCVPDFIPWSWLRIPDPGPVEIDRFTIDGKPAAWLGDINGLVMALRGADMAGEDVREILNNAVTRALAHLQRQVPEGVALSLHEHAHETAYAKA